MTIFRKQRPGMSPTVQRTTATLPRRPEHPVSISPNQAMERVHAAAEQAREEIAALVEAEHEAIDRTIAAACEETEERLRGATERRIDIEMKQHLEEVESKLRRDVKRMVRAEIAKAAKAGRNARSKVNSDDNGSVPIQARARP